MGEDDEAYGEEWYPSGANTENEALFNLMREEMAYQLSPRQLDIFQKCILREMSSYEYERSEGVSHQSVYHSLRLIKEKMKKVLKKVAKTAQKVPLKGEGVIPRCTLKIECSLAEYIPTAARKGEQVSGHRPCVCRAFAFGMPCGSTARIAMTGGGDNDTSLQSQAEREKTVAANEEGSARTADGVQLP